MALTIVNNTQMDIEHCLIGSRVLKLRSSQEPQIRRQVNVFLYVCLQIMLYGIKHIARQRYKRKLEKEKVF